MNKILLLLLLCCAVSVNAQQTVLSFDGNNDYVICPSMTFSAFTLEAWVCQSSQAGDQGVISSLDVGTGCGFELHIIDGIPRVTIWDGAGFNDLVMTDAITPNSWVHCAAVFDGWTMTFYLNGVVKGSKSVSAPAQSGPVCLGKRFSGGTSYFSGRLDDVRLWTVARGEPGVNDDMNCAGLGNDTTELFAYYAFEQGTPNGDNTGFTTIDDSTSGGHSGALQDFAMTGSVSNFTGSLAIIRPLLQMRTAADSAQCIISSRSPWTVTGSDAWLSVNHLAGSGTDTIVVSAAATASERTGHVVITDAGGTTDTITVKQSASVNGLAFDGSDDYVTCFPFASNSFTFEAWIKPVSVDRDQAMISSLDVSGMAGFELHIHGDGHPVLTYYDYDIDNIVDFKSSAVITAGTWTHVAFTCTGRSISFYLNGEYVDGTSANIVDGSYAWFRTLSLGRRSDGSTTYRGVLDEVRIWDYARSASGLQQDRNQATPSTETSGLMAYYAFDQGVAGGDNAGLNQLLDASPNGNNGSLNNFALSGSESNWVPGLSASELPLPVELAAFTASADMHGITLRWQTATETDNAGFDIERRRIAEPDAKSADTAWTVIGHVIGAGTSTKAHDYSYTDNLTTPGRYAYRLKQVDARGGNNYSQSAEVTLDAPGTFELAQNYPNPFNPSSTIRYQLPERSRITLAVYDMLGRETARLVDGMQEAGIYSVQLNAAHWASGVYFYRMTAGKFSAVKKFVVMK